MIKALYIEISPIIIIIIIINRRLANQKVCACLIISGHIVVITNAPHTGRSQSDVLDL